MKKIVIGLLLMLLIATGISVDPVKMNLRVDTIGCIHDTGEVYYCAQENYIEDIEIKFLEDVYCRSSGETPAGNMLDVMDGGCSSKVEFTAHKMLMLPFLKVIGEEISDESATEVEKEIPLEPGDHSFTLIDPLEIERSKCILDEEDPETGIKSYKCDYKGTHMTVDGQIIFANNNMIFTIYENKGEGQSIWSEIIDNWVYILLILVAVFVIYNIVKRKN